MSLNAVYSWCEYEEMVDYAFFYYLRAVQIWRIADLLFGIDLMDSPT